MLGNVRQADSMAHCLVLFSILFGSVFG